MMFDPYQSFPLEPKLSDADREGFQNVRTQVAGFLETIQDFWFQQLDTLKDNSAPQHSGSV